MMYRLHNDDLFINLNTIKKITKKNHKYIYQDTFYDKDFYTLIFLDGSEEVVPEEIGRNILKSMGLINPMEKMKVWCTNE